MPPIEVGGVPGGKGATGASGTTGASGVYDIGATGGAMGAIGAMEPCWDMDVWSRIGLFTLPVRTELGISGEGC